MATGSIANPSVSQGARNDPLPSPAGRQDVWAGAILLVAGLGLIFLAGCFLIGAMYLAKPELLHPALRTDVMSSQSYSLMVTLCVVAGLCLLGAFVVCALGVRVLLRVAKSD